MISIQNLSKRFGKFTAVDGLSFNVQPGEVFGFLGANGAGKTTTIRMMCGLLQPSEGDITVNGISVRTSPEKVKQSLGYMSQKFSLYKDLSPEWNLDFFGSVYSVVKQRLDKEKNRMKVELGSASWKRPAGELPMGFKQRLGLTCALLHEPPVIFLDEPTSGVDPVGRREFWEEIYQFSTQGKTILVTTNFMDEAEYCDRIGIMSFGRLIDLDTPDSIKKKYNTETLNDAFIAAVNQDRISREGEPVEI